MPATRPLPLLPWPPGWSTTGDLWVVGAHGGAGESTLAELSPRWVPARHAWPQVDGRAAAPCLLVARTSARGLFAAQEALTQWAASDAGAVSLLGLAFVADAPGRLPQGLRDLAAVVAGGAPRVWDVPWRESWRVGAATTERLPRALRKFVTEINQLVDAGGARAGKRDR